MSDPTLTADRGEQLIATFTYSETVAGPAEFVVRQTAEAPDPPLLSLRTDTASTDGDLTLSGNEVTLLIHGPKTLTLPSYSVCALWLRPGEDDAQVLSGILRIKEVAQP